MTPEVAGLAPELAGAKKGQGSQAARVGQRAVHLLRRRRLRGARRPRGELAVHPDAPAARAARRLRGLRRDRSDRGVDRVDGVTVGDGRPGRPPGRRGRRSGRPGRRRGLVGVPGGHRGHPGRPAGAGDGHRDRARRRRAPPPRTCRSAPPRTPRRPWWSSSAAPVRWPTTWRSCWPTGPAAAGGHRRVGRRRGARQRGALLDRPRRHAARGGRAAGRRPGPDHLDGDLPRPRRRRRAGRAGLRRRRSAPGAAAAGRPRGAALHVQRGLQERAAGRAGCAGRAHGVDRRRADPGGRGEHRDLRAQPQPGAHRARPGRLGAQPGDRDRRDRRRRARQRHRPVRRRAAVLPVQPRHPRGRGPAAGRARLLRRDPRPASPCPSCASGWRRPSRPSSPSPAPDPPTTTRSTDEDHVHPGDQGPARLGPRPKGAPRRSSRAST